MIDTLIKLHKTLWKRNLGNNTAQVLLIVMVYFYAAGGAMLLYALAWQPLHDGQSTILPALTGIGIISYLLLCGFMPAAENQLQPESLSALPISGSQLFRAHLAILPLQSRSILAIILTLVTCIYALFAAGWSWLLIPMLAVQLLITLVAGEVLSGLLAKKTDRRTEERKRAFTAILGFLLIIGYNIIIRITPKLGTISLAEAGEYLAWTPLGAAAGVVAAGQQSDLLTALAQFLIAGVTLGVLVWWWPRSLSERLVAPLSSGYHAETHTKVSSTVLLPWAPRNRFGLVYSRALRYLRRDSRMSLNLLMLPLMAAFFIFQGLNDGMWYPGALMLGVLGSMMVTNDFGYDGPANWVHMVTGVPERTLILGRQFALLTPLWLTTLGYLAVMVAFSPNRVDALWVAVISVAFALAGAGFGMVFSVRNPFAVAGPGTNPWQDRSGYSAAAFLTAFGAMFTCWIPLVPGLGLLIAGFITGSLALKAAGAAVSLAIAMLAYWLTLRHSTRYLENHYPEIFFKVRSWVK